MGTEISNSEIIIGCDIGNAFGYVSYLKDSEQDPIPLIPGKYNLPMGMPTDAYITPPAGEPIQVFRKKRSSAATHRRKPELYVRAIKTRLKEGKLTIPGIEAPIDPDKIYASIAEDLIRLANETFFVHNIPPVYNLVFAFPASLADETDLLERMQKSIESVCIDGRKVKVAGRLPEPAAVAIDYLHYMQHIAPESIRITDDRFTVLVYDLGYGTFDTAVVTADSKRNPYTLHTKGGLPEIGGKNFDDVIFKEFCRILSERDGFVPRNSDDCSRIMEAAVSAKLELSENDSSVQEIWAKDGYKNVELSRERFEQLSEHLLMQTLGLVQEELDYAEQAGIAINAIVLSGGCSQMPMIKRALTQLADGKYPVILYRPSEAVSFGAARYARGIHRNTSDETGQNEVLEQKTDCCYGVWVPGNDLKGEIRFLIPAGRKRPAVSETYAVRSNSSRMAIRVFRFNEKNKSVLTADVEECVCLRWFHFDVRPGTNYNVTITALEDYSIRVELTTEEGEKLTASSKDPVV